MGGALLIPKIDSDRAIAKQLLETVRQKNPGQTFDWCCEKVIYDLERDRVKNQ